MNIKDFHFSILHNSDEADEEVSENYLYIDETCLLDSTS